MFLNVSETEADAPNARRVPLGMMNLVRNENHRAFVARLRGDS